MIDLHVITGNITCNSRNGKMDRKSGKEQDAKANSYHYMTTPDDSYDPFMVSMGEFCGWEKYADSAQPLKSNAAHTSSRNFSISRSMTKSIGFPFQPKESSEKAMADAGFLPPCRACD